MSNLHKLTAIDFTVSKIKGAKGNREFLLLFKMSESGGKDLIDKNKFEKIYELD